MDVNVHSFKSMYICFKVCTFIKQLAITSQFWIAISDFIHPKIGNISLNILWKKNCISFRQNIAQHKNIGWMRGTWGLDGEGGLDKGGG